MFFFNATATTEIYTLSLHDALPISPTPAATRARIRIIPTRRTIRQTPTIPATPPRPPRTAAAERSEEHTSELQSQFHLVCRLLLEKKKKKKKPTLRFQQKQSP